MAVDPLSLLAAADDVYVFPLSFAQRRLWLIDRLDPGNPAYNIPAAVRIDGPFDLAAFEAAVNEVVRRHETLRTNILVVDREPQQAIAAARSIAVRVVDLRADPDAGVAVITSIQDETLAPFDLSADPLLRVVVYRLAPDAHVVQLTIHHIVSDGWSMGLLVQEIAVAYAAYREHRQPSLPELPIQYADYAEWQNDWLKGDVLAGHLAYWRGQLAGPLPLLELPIDRPRPALQTFGGASVPFDVSARQTAALAEIARQEGATLFMALLAVFSALLHRYTGQDDIVVGSPIANRNRREVEGLIGFFVNTLALRTTVTGTMTFRELLRGARDTALDAYAHQDLPFEQLVEALQPDRGLGHTPLFQVLFALQNLPAAPAAIGDALVTSLTLESTTAKFDLSVSLTEADGGLRAAAEFNTALFDRETIERLVAHFQTLAAAVTAAPDLPMARLPLLTADDGAALERWNDTAATFAPVATLHALVEAQARATPDAPAVRFDGETMSYAELNQRANRLAAHLRAGGAGPETIVGVCLERSLDLVVTLLAVLKSGAAYLPLDPTYPAERLHFMQTDAGAAQIVSWRRLATACGLDERATICLDEIAPALTAADGGDCDAGAASDHAAYVIYTSGSTGRPKGVVNTHGGIVNRLQWMQAEYRLTPDDRVIQKTPYGFDVSVWEFFQPLLAGALLVVARPDGHKDPAYLADLMAAERVTIAHFVPSMLRVFLATPRAGACGTLRQVICSGEALPPDVADLCMASLDADLSNLYGPTEAAVEVTFWRCRRYDRAPRVPIGRPIANIQMHIVDEAMAPAPAGIAGDLLIGGVGLARGYLNRPELTAERFVPNPFGPPGSRLYRTGDRARRLADGAIDFLGRADFQVKIRGFRVETGEIEARLTERPDIAAALVVVRPAQAGDDRLVAYVVAAAGSSIDVAALRAHLAAHLPDYMVPAAFVTLAALPLSGNGKIDRAALPEPSWDQNTGRDAVAPRTSTEEILHGIWHELLGVERFGVDDSFFSLGGHSLLATQVISRIAELFEVELPLRIVFERPTIAGLAVHLDEVRRASAGLTAPPLEPAPRGGAMPLSFAQQRLWFLSQIAGAGAAYNMPAALRIEGALDAGLLEHAIVEIVRRHEVLRTRFVVQHGTPVQLIDDDAHVTLGIEDLRRLDAADAAAEVHRRAAEEFERPFDLARGPLVRARLLVLGDSSHVLLLTTHHIVSDGWSTTLLVDDLVHIYEAAVSNVAATLAPLRVQYADFAAWQRQWLAGPVLQAQIDYWTRQLEGAPDVSQMPLDRPRPAVQTFNGDIRTFAFGADLTSRIKRLGERAGATTFMTMMAAFVVLVTRYSRQRDIVIGTPSLGRTRKELEPLVGFFLNTLAIRLDVTSDPTFQELIARVRHVTLDAYAHQDVPFEQIVEAVQPERSMSHTPLFQIIFSGALPDASPVTLPNVRVTPLSPAKVAAKFDLTVGFADSERGITGSFEYNTDLFDEATIARMIGHFTTLVEAAVAAPGDRISALAIVPDEERRQLMELARLKPSHGATASPVPSPAAPLSVVDRIAAVAAAHGEAIAVAGDTSSITYRELEQHAEAFAHRLQSLGVRREDRVAVCGERSIDLVVAMLGVMKAGAAYVPLDPGAPIDRRRFMIEDSGAGVVVAARAVAADLRTLPGAVTVIDLENVRASDREARNAAGVARASVDPDQLAYVIYTSGSTGVPKGVAISHRALLNLIDWHDDAFGITATDRASLVASVTFDASVWETWPYLAAGASIHIAGDALVKSPSALVRWLIEQRVSVAFLPTPLAEQMLGADWRGTALRHLLIGGDRLHRQPPAGLPFTVVNNYGPTENTVVATSGTLTADEGSTAPSIGRGIAGVEIYLVDERLELAPLGAPGEIAIGGASLARGYHGRLDLTAAQFVPHPFSRRPGARLYRTGDLARWRADGTLDFLGRTDRQVKVRGVRIEPGEIESMLAGHPDVDQAVVTLGDAALIGYVTLHRAAAPEALRQHLRERLPEHLVPWPIVALDALPLTAHGKVDYRALPSPSRQDLRTAGYVAPRNEIERTIGGIWESVLGVDQIGVHDNFFDVGGHSLKLVEVHERLRQALGGDLTIVEMFQYPTIAGLADRFAPEGSAAGTDTVVAGAQDRVARQRAARARQISISSRLPVESGD